MLKQIRTFIAECQACHTEYEKYGITKEAIIASLLDDDWAVTTKENVLCPDCHITYFEEETEEVEVYDLSGAEFIGIKVEQ